VNKTRIILRIRRILNNRVFADEEIRVLLREIIHRFCARSDHARICARFATNVDDFDAFIRAILIAARNGDQATIELPDTQGSTPTGPVKRADALASFADILSGAISDADAVFGYNIEQFGQAISVPNGATATGTDGNMNGATSVVASLLAIAFAFVVLF